MEQHVRCNLCDKDDARLVFTINGYRIVKCRSCGLMYVNPRLKEKNLHKIYTKDYYKNTNFKNINSKKFFGYEIYIEEKDDIVNTFKRRLDRIEKYKKKGKILDVGCAAGFFLELAKKRDWDVYGTDLSKFACDYAKKKLCLSNVFCCDLEKVKFESNMFDVVVIFDVVEHLSDPKRTLKEISRILKKDGMIVITTPNSGSLIARTLGKRWEEVKRVREHIYFFSEESLAKMLRLQKFRILRVESAGRYFSMKAAVRRGKINFPKAFTVLHDLIRILGIENRKVFINPHYKMTVYAVKNE